MKVFEIVSYLQSIAPESFQESYDNAGLIVGNLQTEVTKVLVSLDTTEKVVEDAIEKGCNVIISHHPIIFKGIKKFDAQYYVDKAIIKAIKNDIAIYAIHTNLDNVYTHGVSTALAEILQLKDIEILSPHESTIFEQKPVGAGAIGYLAEPTDSLVFLKELKSIFQLQCIKHTPIIKSRIGKVAVCGGSGSFLISDAIAAGADILITADIKYHEFFDANGQIILADIGHYESEKHVIQLIKNILSNHFQDLHILSTEVITNPVSYF